MWVLSVVCRQINFSAPYFLPVIIFLPDTNLWPPTITRIDRKMHFSLFLALTDVFAVMIKKKQLHNIVEGERAPLRVIC